MCWEGRNCGCLEEGPPGHWGLREELGRTSKTKYHFAKGIGVYLPREKRSQRKGCWWVWWKVPGHMGSAQPSWSAQEHHRMAALPLRLLGKTKRPWPAGATLRAGISRALVSNPIVVTTLPLPTRKLETRAGKWQSRDWNQSCQNPKPELSVVNWHQVSVRQVESDGTSVQRPWYLSSG